MVHLRAVATVTNEHISGSRIREWSASPSQITRDGGGGANGAHADVPPPPPPFPPNRTLPLWSSTSDYGLLASRGHQHA